MWSWVLRKQHDTLQRTTDPSISKSKFWRISSFNLKIPVKKTLVNSHFLVSVILIPDFEQPGFQNSGSSFLISHKQPPDSFNAALTQLKKSNYTKEIEDKTGITFPMAFAISFTKGKKRHLYIVRHVTQFNPARRLCLCNIRVSCNLAELK